MEEERLKEILQNAIQWMEEDDVYFDCDTNEDKFNKLEDLIGITKEEYLKIMENSGEIKNEDEDDEEYEMGAYEEESKEYYDHVLGPQIDTLNKK